MLAANSRALFFKCVIVLFFNGFFVWFLFSNVFHNCRVPVPCCCGGGSGILLVVYIKSLHCRTT